jgi:hypothetical protein
MGIKSWYLDRKWRLFAEVSTAEILRFIKKQGPEPLRENILYQSKQIEDVRIGYKIITVVKNGKNYYFKTNDTVQKYLRLVHSSSASRLLNCCNCDESLHPFFLIKGLKQL